MLPTAFGEKYEFQNFVTDSCKQIKAPVVFKQRIFDLVVYDSVFTYLQN